jgi:predicted nuclease of predicted toxin-antitoxin system
MGTLSTELAPFAQRHSPVRIYADANLPAGVVAFMRQRLGWDVLHVIEHGELRRAPDLEHYQLARRLQRTLMTIDRDYLDETRFPRGEGSGVIVVWAPSERLLTRLLHRLDRFVFRSEGASPLPLEGRKLFIDSSWRADAEVPE